MKYDILEAFKEYLNGCGISKNSSKTYYSAVVKILEPLQFNDLSEIDPEFLLTRMKEVMKTKNEFSAAKNGFLRLKEMNPHFKVPSESRFKEISEKKRNFSKKQKKVIYLDTVKRKINQIENPKLKYAYRLALISGLRINELSFVKDTDLSFENGIITVKVTHGKGESNGIIECQRDEYLYEKLQEYVKEHKGKLFYTEAYMREIADNLGFECHDLRRSFAITTRNEAKKEMPIEQANALVKEKLRHVRFSTTKRYLFNRKLVVKRRREEETDGR